MLEQLSLLEDISSRPMMGEYVIYYRGRVAGGIYDERLFVKAVGPALEYLPDTAPEPPYEGARPMLPVAELDSREFLKGLFEAMFDALPPPRPKKPKRQARDTLKP